MIPPLCAVIPTKAGIHFDSRFAAEKEVKTAFFPKAKMDDQRFALLKGTSRFRGNDGAGVFECLAGSTAMETGDD
ncbi:hypothetical protein FQY83_14315 [Luteimonas marina]|uniref:Uncharacterized protein n=1 Tax=Luteimonas marina TaxID=488485 RepID=A0A5C5TYS1_9GAMM|nr:hypothetical protein [Luteimonas marina]TWT18548.1 hypothetical protein FQY83_14315 [Luteimonas marina]